ncbi:unnamed protein product [Pleuronectes platessa]|uniref:Uncharacterized protein n=1 Tax=Pleuronectes platessa TaxID=8262 RepID=A0A9N7U641_PLEPL|nr:unnamed protein product [Pleuronectes platessa]
MPLLQRKNRLKHRPEGLCQAQWHADPVMSSVEQLKTHMGIDFRPEPCGLNSKRACQKSQREGRVRERKKAAKRGRTEDGNLAKRASDKNKLSFLLLLFPSLSLPLPPLSLLRRSLFEAFYPRPHAGLFFLLL